MKFKLLICLILLAGSVSAQFTYIIQDTLTKGVRIYNRGEINNAKYCERLVDGQLIRYTPYDLNEYGFVDGQVYVSKEITLGDTATRVFLEKIKTGQSSLYYYRNENSEFYILENEKMQSVQIPRKTADRPGWDYHDILAAATADCDKVSDAAKLVSYRKTMMAMFTARYNSCTRRPFPFFKVGAFAGMNYSGLNYVAGIGNDFIKHKNKYYQNANFKYEEGFIYGVFIDYPLAASDFSLHPEIYFTKNNYSSEYELDDLYVQVEINTAAINIPVLFRYSAPVNKARPYMEAGGIYAYQYKDEFSTLTIPEDQGTYPAPVVTNMVGAAAGTGCEIDITYRMRLFLDLRYTYLMGLRISAQETYYKNEWTFTVGFSY